MLQASILELSVKTTGRHSNAAEIYGIARTAMFYAYHINQHHVRDDTETSMLDNLDQILTRWNRLNRRDTHWSDELILDDSGISAGVAFLRIATTYGLGNYVDEKLAGLNPDSREILASQLLLILLPFEAWPAQATPPLERLEVVSTILRNGADPNFEHGTGSCKMTPWSSMLWYLDTYAEHLLVLCRHWSWLGQMCTRGRLDLEWQ